MAKYELQPAQSMYRDTGAVAVNTLKRQEYLANMQADNTLATSVMNMEAMPQDTEKLGELADLYNSNINSRSERKDYENLGMSIHKDAMAFVKDYSPIKRELEKFNAYKASLDKRLASTGPDRISRQQYNNALRISNDKYKGVANNSKFQGIGVASYVDVDKRIQEKIKDYVQSEMSETIELPADQNYTVFTEENIKGNKIVGPPRHYIKVKNEKKYFTPGAVQNIVNGVMKEHDVESFISQEAMFETYGKGLIPDGSETSISDNEVDGKISSLTKNISKLKKLVNPSNIEKYELEENEKMLSLIQDMQGRGETNNAIHTALVAFDIQSEYANRANIKYSYVNTNYEKTIKDIKTDGNNKTDAPKPQIQYQVSAQGLNHTVLGGVSTKEKEAYIKTNEETLTAIKENPQFANLNISGNDILRQLYSINTEEEAQAFADLPGNNIADAATVLNLASSAKRARNQIELVRQQLDKGYNDANYEGRQGFKDTVGTIFEGYYGGQLGAEYDETTGTWNNLTGHKEGAEDTEGDPMDAYSITYQKVVSIPAVAELKGDMSTYDFLDRMVNDDEFNLSVQDAVLNNVKTGDYGQGTAISKADAEANVRTRVSQMANMFEKFVDEKSEAVEKAYIKEIKPTGVVATSYGAQTKEASEEMKEFFTTGYNEGLVVYGPNGRQITIGELKGEPGFKDIKGQEGRGYEILADGGGLLNITRDGEAVIGIPIRLSENVDDPSTFGFGFGKDIYKKGDVLMFYAPVDQIGGIPSIQNYVNTTEFKVQELWQMGESAAVPSFGPPMFEDPNDIDPATNEPRRTVIFNYTDQGPSGSNAIQIWDPAKQQYEGYGKVSGLNEIATFINKENPEGFAF